MRVCRQRVSPAALAISFGAGIRTGLGGVAFHLAQFNLSSAFPHARGLVASAFVAGFVGSGLAFFVLRAVINALGGSYAAYRCDLLTGCRSLVEWDLPCSRTLCLAQPWCSRVLA